jgi:WhiB family transcriptional regulator, redox-sensing transcriptional regulator
MGRLSSAMPVVVEPGAKVRAMTDRQLIEVLTRSPAGLKPCTRVGADREEWQRQASSELADRRAAAGEEMRARRLCAGCPVRQECLELALRGEPVEGVQGGTTERSRRTLRHRRARDPRRAEMVGLGGLSRLHRRSVIVAGGLR